MCIYDVLSKERHITSNKTKIKTNIKYYWNTLGKMNTALQKTNEELNSFHDNVLQELSEIRKMDDNVLQNYGSVSDKTIPIINTFEITYEDLQNAINQSHNGKAVGPDDIPNEFIKQGGKSLTRSLTSLFNVFKNMNKIPEEWKQGIVIPIPKSGDLKDLNNYRGITLNSCVSKLYSKIIEIKLRDFIEKNNILGDIQGGFRSNRCCEDNIFILKGIATLRKSVNKSTYVAFLDFSKAFDRVWRDGLRVILWRTGIRGNIWNIIDDMYDNLKIKVNFNDIETDFFEITEGVKQGCVLSPLLFSIYINELAKMLKDSNVGVQIDDLLIPGLFWADDVVLIGNNHTQLQSLLNIAATFAKQWKLTFNETKSEIMYFGKRLHDKNKKWNLGDLVLKETCSYKYLGVIITRSLKDHEHFKNVYQKGMKLIAYCKSLINNHNGFNRFLYGDVLWNNIILPTISYGSSVWFLQSKNDIKKLNSLQYQFGKFLFRENKNVARPAVLGDLGWTDVHTLLDRTRVKYLDRLQNMNQDRWTRVVFGELNKLYENKTNLVWNWPKYIHSILIENGLDHIYKSDPPPHSGWFNSFKVISKHNENITFQRTIENMKSLQHYIWVKKDNKRENYVKDQLDQYGISLFFKVRSNSLDVEGNKLNWHSYRGKGECKMCPGEIEDIYHFLFTCKHFEDTRKTFYLHLNDVLTNFDQGTIMNQFHSGSLNFKFNMLFGNVLWEILYDLGESISQATKSFIKTLWKERSTLMNS